MSKHTPGPWRYDGRAYIWGPETEMVAMLDDDDSKHVAMIRGTGANLPQDANARLIAAAPDLLEACRLAIRVSSLVLMDNEQHYAHGLGNLSVQKLGELREACQTAVQKAENGE